MKIRVFQEKEKKEMLVLRLFYDPCWLCTTLAVVDSIGNVVPNGCLLRFYDESKVVAVTGVDRDFGLPLDEAGRLKIEAE